MSVVVKIPGPSSDQYTLVIERNESITVCRHNVFNGKSYSDSDPLTFKIGDIAEYDSYNLSYLGKIVSITEKTVTIEPRYEKTKRRLKLYEFAWRNYNFNLEQVEKENHETSMYI